MTPAIIIKQAAAAGVSLILSPSGNLKARGDDVWVNNWLPTIRKHRAAIIEELKSNSALADNEEAVIRAWLAYIEETDQVIISETLSRCRAEPEAKAYFLLRAEEIKQQTTNDDRITCGQCANLVDERCQAALRGDIQTSRFYNPVNDLPRRCEGYTPGNGDPNQNNGRERWPPLYWVAKE